MGKKLLELNAGELAAALLEIAEPIGNLVNDEPLFEAFKKATANGVSLRVNDRSGLQFLMKTYAEVIPMLLSPEHTQDVFRIISVVEGEPISKLMKMNGLQVLKDAYAAFKEQLKPFFTFAAPMARRE